MSSLIQEATIRIRQNTSGNWTSDNPTPLQGEWCLETDTGKVKIGDGSTAWTSLEYAAETGLPEQVATNTANLPDSADQLCKAWVNFDGTTNVGGFCTIRDSYNVTSVSDRGAGRYTVNFTNNMSNVNYSVSGSGSSDGMQSIFFNIDGTAASALTTSSVKVATVNASSVNSDSGCVTVQVFGS